MNLFGIYKYIDVFNEEGKYLIPYKIKDGLVTGYNLVKQCDELIPINFTTEQLLVDMVIFNHNHEFLKRHFNGN